MRWVARDSRGQMFTAVLLTVLNGCGFDWTLPSSAGGDGEGGNPSTSNNGGATGHDGGAGANPTTGGAPPDGGAPADGGAPSEGGAGGNPTTTTTGNPTDCRTCAESAANGVCDTYREICDDTGSCLSIAECALDCEGDYACVMACTDGETTNEINAFLDLAACTVCNVCASQCPEYDQVCSQ